MSTHRDIQRLDGLDSFVTGAVAGAGIAAAAAALRAIRDQRDVNALHQHVDHWARRAGRAEQQLIEVRRDAAAADAQVLDLEERNRLLEREIVALRRRPVPAPARRAA